MSNGLFYKFLVGDVFDWLEELEDESVDLVLTSPPYYQLRDYGFDEQIGQESTPEEYVEVMGKLHDEIYRVLKPTGSFWLNIGDSYGTTTGSGQYGNLGRSKYQEVTSEAAKLRRAIKGEYKSLLMIPEQVALRTKESGFTLRNKVIWYKPNHLPSSIKDRLTCSWEYIYFFTKEHSGYTFNLDDIREPIKESTAKKVRRAKKRKPKYGIDWHCKNEGRPEGSRDVKRKGRKTMEQTIDLEKGKNPGDMWAINTQAHAIPHVAIYPDELCEKVILAASNEGDVVLDPFLGSGTTMLAAHKLGRSCIGIDGDVRNIEIVKERIKGFTHADFFTDNIYHLIQMNVDYNEFGSKSTHIKKVI